MPYDPIADENELYTIEEFHEEAQAALREWFSAFNGSESPTKQKNEWCGSKHRFNDWMNHFLRFMSW